jgi:branched-chain amino acid transport system permease protein
VTQFLQATATGLSLASIYILLALGFVIIYKSMQVLSFAHPALTIAGAYMVSLLATEAGLSFWLAVPVGLVAAGVLGWFSERVFVRPMIGKPVFAIAILTIGLDIALRTPVTTLIGLQFRTVGDPWGFNTWQWGDVVVQQRSGAMVVATTLVVLALFTFFRYSRMGLAMRATAVDQETALAQGINVGRIFSVAWVLAAALAALAGMFASTGLAGLNQSTWVIALRALPAIVIGGLDSIGGAVLGGLVIGLAEAYTATYQPQYASFLGSNFSQVMPYVVMLLVLLIRPYGLFGTREVERV